MKSVRITLSFGAEKQCAVEVGDGAGLGSNYSRARTGVCGHGFPQDYQAKGGAFQQTYQARASGGAA